MIIILSPSKTLDFRSNFSSNISSLPKHLNKSKELIDILKSKSSCEIQNLMNLSDNLSKLNLDRYNKWELPFTEKNSKPAIFSFKGSVYSQMDVYNYSERILNYAQNNFRILSGLYGILKPFDLIQEYRLEMGTKLNNPKGKNLYDFWRGVLDLDLNYDISKTNSIAVVNLASKEYYSSINFDKINVPIISPQFKDLKNGEYKMIGIYAKKARGKMCDYLLKNEVKEINKIKDIEILGYKFNNNLSNIKTDNQWIFTRDKVEE